MLNAPPGGCPSPGFPLAKVHKSVSLGLSDVSPVLARAWHQVACKCLVTSAGTLGEGLDFMVPEDTPVQRGWCQIQDEKAEPVRSSAEAQLLCYHPHGAPMLLQCKQP